MVPYINMEGKPVMTIEEMRALLQQSLKPKRYEHSLRVYETALKMAKHYRAEEQKVALAALLHDCGRQVSKEESVDKAREMGIPVDPVEEAQPILLHAKLGVYYAIHKYGVDANDKEVLDAIRYHSTTQLLSISQRKASGGDWPQCDLLL